MTPLTPKFSRRGAKSLEEPLFRKLKPGPGHSADEVFEDQHARLHGAMVELVDECGYENVTVRKLSGVAGISTGTFYKHFANIEECFASTHELLRVCALRRTMGARKTHRYCDEGVHAGLRSLMQVLAERPKEARLGLVESFTASPALRKQTWLAVRDFEQLLADSLGGPSEEVAVPLRVVQGMVAGVTRVAGARLRAGEDVDPSRLAEELGDWILSLRRAYAKPGESKTSRDGTGGAGGSKGSAISPAPPREGIGDERERLLSTTAKLGADIGYQTLTVTRIRTEAGVSRRSFDTQFAGVEDCFLESIEMLMVTAARRAARRADGAGSWEQGVQRAAEALCAQIARHSALAKLGFVEIFAPGRAGLDQRERLVAWGADYLRREAPSAQRPSELVAEASIAAVWRMVQAEVAAGRSRELPRVAPTVACVLSTPAGGAPRADRLSQA